MLTLTLEQQSWAHRVPVGRKLLVLFGATLFLFPVVSLPILSACLAVVAALYLSVGFVALKAGLAMARPIAFVCAIILAYQLFIGDVLAGVGIVLKILAMVGFANFVTMTSRLSDMMDVTMRLLSPFERFGVNTRAVALAFALVMRFTPVLILKGAALTEAWRARSGARAKWHVTIPLVLLALDDAELVAQALRARGGMGQNGDTPWNET